MKFIRIEYDDFNCEIRIGTILGLIHLNCFEPHKTAIDAKQTIYNF